MTLLRFLDFAGVAVFAASGVLAAGRRKLDVLGAMVIALAASIGGGTLRDLLLDRTVFWLTDTTYLAVIFVTTLCTIIYVRFRHPPEHALQIADALGLALFTISGSQIAEAANYPGLIAVVMGTITGVCGGVLRDVLCAEIPMILRKGSIYATAAIAGATLYVMLRELGVERNSAALVGMSLIATLRVAAIYLQISLPTITLRDPDRPGNSGL